MLQQRKISVVFLCKHNRFFALDVNGAHSAPTSEKQSPMVAQKHSPQTQSSPAAQQSPTMAHPSPPAPHPSPATTQPSPLLMEPGPGAPHSSPPVPQSSLPVSQAGLEAMQSGSAVTQAAAVVDPGIPGVQPTSIGSVPVPPQLYLHDTRYCLSGNLSVCLVCLSVRAALDKGFFWSTSSC